MLRSALAALLLALAVGAAQAQQLRTLPADAKRGEIRHLQAMEVTINGEPMLLGPGAQIRDTSNRIVMPAAVPPGALVKYLVNAQGHLFRVWILTPQEAAQRDERK